MAQEEYIKQLEEMIKSLQNQVFNLTDMVSLLTKKQFGSSSEKTKPSETDGQINLFNEAEAEYKADAPEPEKVKVEGHDRKKQKGHREDSCNRESIGTRASYEKKSCFRK